MRVAAPCGISAFLVFQKRTSGKKGAPSTYTLGFALAIHHIYLPCWPNTYIARGNVRVTARTRALDYDNLITIPDVLARLLMLFYEADKLAEMFRKGGVDGSTNEDNGHTDKPNWVTPARNVDSRHLSWWTCVVQNWSIVFVCTQPGEVSY